MTTDTHAEAGGRRARRLHRRRHGEGLRDDPSRPRDDARRRHDRLPARAGRGDRASSGPRSTRASTRSRSTASARRTTRVVLLANGASGDRAHAGDRRRVRAPRCSEVCARARARRSSPTARASTVLAEIAVTRRRRPTRRRRRSRAASRPRRSSRRRSSATTRTGAACSMAAGSAPYNGGYADVDPDRVHARRYNGIDRPRPRRAAGRRARRSRRRRARSSSTSASATARPRYLTSDLSYDYVRINADYRT